MAAIRVRTSAVYKSLPITIIGYDDVALIAVAAYATPREQALAVITVRRSSSGRRYHVAGRAGSVATLAEAARLVAELREDANGGGG